MNSRTVAIVMAAGKSTRMKSALPKALHLIAGKPITGWVIDACREAGIGQVIVVVGHQAGLVTDRLGGDVLYARQEQQLGTGHAVRQAVPLVPDDSDIVLVLPGDAPLITAGTLRKLVSEHVSNGAAATLLTTVLDDPGSYGRVVRAADGSVEAIVEAKDADEQTLALREVNSSIYCFDRGLLERNLERLSNDNAQGEYYLTDVIGLMKRDGCRVAAVRADDPAEILGINNRRELAEAAAIVRGRILDRLMINGVSVIDPATTYVDWDVEIGPDTVIYPCTIIESGTRIGARCRVGPFAYLRGVTIPDDCGEVSS